MNSQHLYIREISPNETYPIRQQILRPGRPLEEVQFSGDTDKTTIHFGAFLKDELIGIATFVKNHHQDFKNQEQYQLRGMAVLPEVQKMHIGQRLLQWGETFLKTERKTEVLWCNARKSAVAFYQKNNYSTHGDFFEIPNVCTHIVMYRRL